MENEVINYKHYVIVTEESVKSGLFFRSPLQDVEFDAYPACGENDGMHSAWIYYNKLKNPIKRIYEILLGNGNIVKNIESWTEKDNWAGFNANILCPPIYFKRAYRKLTAESQIDNNIKSIYSYGYESEFNIVSGRCVKEITKLKLMNGKTVKIKQKDTYNYTYAHSAKTVIDTMY